MGGDQKFSVPNIDIQRTSRVNPLRIIVDINIRIINKVSLDIFSVVTPLIRFLVKMPVTGSPSHTFLR